MILNPDCYTFEEHYYNKGFLDESVDATYILYLEGNGRYDQVLQQLSVYKPTKIVYIVVNKGFKRCTKPLYVDIPPLDLVDANLEIFTHAAKKKYNNILILEDDFLFNEKIIDPIVSNRINSFILKQGDRKFLYSLGCVPLFLFPYDQYTYYGNFTATHACIFSKEYREDFARSHKKHRNILDWDAWNPVCYTYYEPLCYQLFPETENQKYWGSDGNYWGSYISKMRISLLRLDVQPEPGYFIIYTFAKMLFWIYIFIFIFLVYFIYSMWQKGGFRAYIQTGKRLFKSFFQ